VPGAKFLDALSILRALYEAHRVGDSVPMRRLHDASRLSGERIEALLEEMSAARWVGRVGNDWALIRDPAEIRVADVFQLLVYRADTRLAARASAHGLDGLEVKIAGAIDGGLAGSIEDLFRDPGRLAPAAPVRIQAIPG